MANTDARVSDARRLEKVHEKKNILTYNGLEMFIYQGQKSFFLWNKINPEIDIDLKKKIESKLK